MESGNIILNTLNIVGGILLMAVCIPQLYKGIIDKSIRQITLGFGLFIFISINYRDIR